MVGSGNTELRCQLSDPGEWVDKHVTLTFEPSKGGDKITCTTNPGIQTFTCDKKETTDIGSAIPIDPKSVGIKATYTGKGPASYRCSVAVGEDDPTTDTKLVYAQNIEVKVDTRNFEEASGTFYALSGNLFSVSVFGDDAYGIANNECTLNNVKHVAQSNRLKVQQLTVPEPINLKSETMTLTCKFKFVVSNFETITHEITWSSSAAYTIAKKCNGAQIFDKGCKDCDGENEYRSGDSQFTKCSRCPPGQQPNSAKDGCVKCEKGKYSTEDHSCKSCEPGTYSADEGAAACTPCSSGFYQNEEGKTACKACKTNTFTPSSGQKMCFLCTNGIVEKNACNVCPKNWVISPTDPVVENKCTPCGEGKYAIEGSTRCYPCPPGSKRGLGDTECESCDKGDYQDEEGQAECKHCKARDGQYQPFTGQSFCYVTAPGHELDNLDTKKPAIECKANEYSTGGAAVCSKCDFSLKEFTRVTGASFCHICQSTISANGNCGAVICAADMIDIEGLGTFSFPETDVGSIAKVQCKTGNLGDEVTRSCNYNALDKTAKFSLPDASACGSIHSEKVEEKTKLIREVDVTDYDAIKTAVEGLSILTSERSKEMSPKDYTNIANTLGDFSSTVANSDNLQIDKATAERIAKTVGAVGNAGETKLNAVDEKDKTKMISCVTEISKKLKEMELVETDTIAMIKLSQTTIAESAEVILPNPKNSIRKGTKLTVKQSTTAPSVSVFDKETAKGIFPKPRQTTKSKYSVTESIDSNIVSLEFGKDDKENNNLEFILEIDIDDSNDSSWGSKYNLTRKCKFVSESGQWDSAGCSTDKVEGKYTCTCNHNTSFAMILSVAEIADTSQSTASTILNTINIIFLVVTLICTAPFQKFWGRRLLQIQMQLCLSLLMAHVAFIILGTAKHDSPGCLPGVIIVQWLFLVVIAWSVCASVTLYDKIVNAIKSYGKKDKFYFIKCFIGCWFFPLIMILSGYVSQILMTKRNPDMAAYLAQSGDLGEAEEESCWVNDPWKYVSFMIPIYLCLLINTLLFVMIAKIIIKAGKSGSYTASHAREVKALISISTTIGLPWLVSVFMFNPIAQVFQWVFIIVTGLQGPTMFVCFVIFQEDVLTNVFSLFGKQPPSVLLSPKSKSSKSAVSESSALKPTTAVARIEHTADDPVEINKAAVEYAEAQELNKSENIYSNEDPVSGDQRDDTSSKSLTSITNGVEPLDDALPPPSAVPAVEEDKDDIDIVHSSYPHVPQLV